MRPFGDRAAHAVVERRAQDTARALAPSLASSVPRYEHPTPQKPSRRIPLAPDRRPHATLYCTGCGRPAWTAEPHLAIGRASGCDEPGTAVWAELP